VRELIAVKHQTTSGSISQSYLHTRCRKKLKSHEFIAIFNNYFLLEAEFPEPFLNFFLRANSALCDLKPTHAATPPYSEW
jgi:hypothetical protein